MESLNNKSKLHIAVTGCIHGELNRLYSSLSDYEKQTKLKIDLVICTGDFQSLIKQTDLNYLACPNKYKRMGDFQYYYSGKYEVPYLTIFIGGNHEASNILDDNFYGGWIMNKIYYLGRSGFIKVKGLSIAGISGIYKINDYFKGHFEKELSSETKSIFHIREYDVAKLSNIKSKIDLFLSHDWPTGIVDKNDINQICRIKSEWRQELETSSLGSFPGEYLLKTLKPKLWICGHMHYFYKNTFYHNESKEEFTKVIALDKCLNRRKFFDVIEMEVDSNLVNDNNIYIPNEWIAISKSFDEIFPKELLSYDYSKYFKDEESYKNFLIEKGIRRNNRSEYPQIDEFTFKENLQKNFENEKEDKEIKFNNIQNKTMVELLGIKDAHNLSKNKGIGNITNTENENIPGYYHNEGLKNEEELDLGI